MYTLLLPALGNLLFLALHITGSGSFPRPLSAREEQECLQKIQQGDTAAKNKLIEHNLRLVAHIIKKYYAVSSDQDDLISIGTIGLIKAVTTFNAEKGARFATYASRCIENEILMYFRARKKTAQDVYLYDPIDTDKDGNALTIVDIMADEHNILDPVGTAAGDDCQAPEPAGTGTAQPAVWAGRTAPPYPEGGGRPAGDLPELCIPH